MIKLTDILKESNQGMWSWYKRQLPNWPDYVIKDMFFTRLKNRDELEDKKEWIRGNKKHFRGIKWKFEKLTLNFNSFNKDTQNTMKRRDMGKLNWSQVPNDEKRHQTQADLIKQRGISKQPLILTKKQGEGYDLIEGWHRAIQYINAFPEGFTVPCWVGYLP